MKYLYAICIIWSLVGAYLFFDHAPARPRLTSIKFWLGAIASGPIIWIILISIVINNNRNS